jgi:hypothetical protein
VLIDSNSPIMLTGMVLMMIVMMGGLLSVGGRSFAATVGIRLPSRLRARPRGSSYRVWFRDFVVGERPVAARADDERSPCLFGPRPMVWGLVADPHSGEGPRRGTPYRPSPGGLPMLGLALGQRAVSDDCPANTLAPHEHTRVLRRHGRAGHQFRGYRCPRLCGNHPVRRRLRAPGCSCGYQPAGRCGVGGRNPAPCQPRRRR